MAWKILIVDDDQTFLDFLKGGLELHGHEVSTSRSGSEAIRQLVGREFDFLIADYFMPEGDGKWLYEAIKRTNLTLAKRMIFVTAGPGEQKVKDFLFSAKCSFLMKPVSLDAVIKEMEWIEKKLK